MNCIKIFFSKRFNYESTLFPSLTRDVVKKVDLDVSLVASGSFTKQMQKELESFFQLQTIEEGDSEENIDDEEFSHDAFTERVNTDYGYSEEEN